MGAEQSHEVNPDKSQFNSNFSKNYTFVKESMDKRFGEIQIYKKKTDEIYLAKRSKNCEGREDFQTAFKLAQKRKDMKHKNLINLVHFSDSSEDNLCGDFNKITLYHDYYMLDLEKELSRRKENNEYLNENEIWYLLDSLVNVNQYIEKNKLYHGDLKPSTIFLTQEGQVKIADSSILSSQKSAYFKALSGEKCNLSPTLLVALKHKDLLPAHDIHKSDVYSLGMTMLEVADLAPAFHCYNWSTKEIIQSKIDECLERIQTRYGEFFAGILRDMLAEKENNRPTFEDINSVLAPYQETIQDMDQQQNQQNQSQLHNSGHNVQTQSRIVQAPTVLQNSQTYFTPQSQNKISQVQYQNSPQTQVIYQQQPQLSSSQIQQVSPRSQIVQPQQAYVVQQQQPQQIYTVSTPVRLVQLQEQQQEQQQQEQKDRSQIQDQNQQQQQQQYVPQFQQLQGNQQSSYIAQNLVHSKYQNPQ